MRWVLGLVGKWEPVETNVLVLRRATSDLRGFTPAKGFGDSLNTLRESLQNCIGGGLSVIDETGLTNRYDFSFVWPTVNLSSDAGKQTIREALYSQLGLELVPAVEPVEMLVVEKVK